MYKFYVIEIRFLGILVLEERVKNLKKIRAQ